MPATFFSINLSAEFPMKRNMNFLRILPYLQLFPVCWSLSEYRWHPDLKGETICLNTLWIHEIKIFSHFVLLIITFLSLFCTTCTFLKYQPKSQIYISQGSNTVSIEVPKKVFWGFDNVFHVYLMRESQKYERNWILTMAFWVTCKIAQPIQPIFFGYFSTLVTPSEL